MQEGASSRALVEELNSKISELEKGMVTGSTAAEREATKQRKKNLREVARFLQDSSTSVEDKMDFLHGRYTAALTEMIKMEKQLLSSEKERDQVTKERDRGETSLYLRLFLFLSSSLFLSHTRSLTLSHTHIRNFLPCSPERAAQGECPE
jgi:hypothetical protein